MLRDLTIRAKLIASLAILTVVACLIAGGGFIALSSSNNSIKTIYDDRLIALSQLDEVIRLIQSDKIAVSRAALESPEQINKSLAEIDENRNRANKVWSEYMATYLTPEEKSLAQQFEQKHKVFLSQGLQPAIGALKNNEVDLVKSLVTHKLGETFLPLRETMNDLIQLQK